MDLRPAEIAMRQFSRALLGADPAEVRQFLVEAAATLERVNSELARAILDRCALQTTLRQTSAKAEDLQRQLASAQEKLAAHQAQESLMSRALLNAQKMTEDLIQGSKAQAERTVAEATAVAQESIRTARHAAIELLRAARSRAEQTVEAADRTAAARMAQIQLETERLAEEARCAVAEVQHAAERQVEQFAARLEAFLTAREDTSRSLDVLARTHAESLEAIARMRAEVEDTVLPALRDLRRGLTEEDAGKSRGPVAPVAPAPPDAAPAPVLAPSPPAGSSSEAAWLARPAPIKDRDPADAPRPRGEIVVSPVHSYLQASKFMTAVSRAGGVRTARLRAYSKGSITIDVMTDTGTLAGFDPHRIDGFPVDVVEVTDRRLVLHIANGGSRPPAGEAGSP
jgi:cell division septum initiation protein DivIVA